MYIDELKEKSDDELKMLAREKNAYLDQLWFMMRQGKQKNNHLIGDTRRDIARILTLLRSRRES